jgi:hypothetical protein
VKFAGCSPPQLVHLGGESAVFKALFRSVLLITFYTPGGSTAES